MNRECEPQHGRSALQWTLGLMIAATLVPAGCSSLTGREGGRSFSWPWSKRNTVPAAPAAYSGARAPGKNPDPFLGVPVPANGAAPEFSPPASRGGSSSSRDGVGYRAAPVSLDQPIALVAAQSSADQGMSSSLDDSAAAGTSAAARAVHAIDAPRRAFRYIVLHHARSESGSLATLESGGRGRAGSPAGMHFVIGNGKGATDGAVQASERWVAQRRGAHLADEAPDRFIENGIGVCLIGDFDRHRPTLRQLEATRQLIATLMREYDIPPYRVLTHSEASLDQGHGRKCPGAFFRIDDVLPAGR